MTTFVTRADIAALKGITPKLRQAFEDLFVDTAAASETAGNAAAATGAIQNATVLTVSPNAAFANERVLTMGDGLNLTLDEATAVLSLAYLIVLQGGFKCSFNLMADTSLDLPVSGRVAALDSTGASFADDAAAAAGGVLVGEIYRQPAGVVAWRQA